MWAFYRGKIRWVRIPKSTVYATPLYWDESALLNILGRNTKTFKGHLQTYLIELVVTVGCGDTMNVSTKKWEAAVDGFVSS